MILVSSVPYSTKTVSPPNRIQKDVGRGGHLGPDVRSERDHLYDFRPFGRLSSNTQCKCRNAWAYLSNVIAKRKGLRGSHPFGQVSI